ncbi:MAG: hypothetical protein C4320_08355 [Armatimonadota bacterium]
MLRFLFVCFALLLVGIGVIREVRRIPALPSGIDFGVYQASARVLERGGNPYSGAEMKAAGTYEGFRYTYLPYTLPVLQLLHGHDSNISYLLFGALKIGSLLLGLYLAWRSKVFPSWAIPLLGALALVGYGNAGLYDLRQGNISLLEFPLSIAAFVFLMQGKPRHFGFVTLLLCIVKPHFLLFVLPGLVLVPRKTVEGLLIGTPLLVGLLVFAAVRYPAFLRTYPSNVIAFDPTLQMGDSFRRLVLRSTGSVELGYAAMAMLLLFTSGAISIILRDRRRGLEVTTAAVCALYFGAALLNPRLPFYAHVHLAAPTLLLLLDAPLRGPLLLGAMLLVCLVPASLPFLITIPLLVIGVILNHRGTSPPWPLSTHDPAPQASS